MMNWSIMLLLCLFFLPTIAQSTMKFTPCPHSPNCVSTQSNSPTHKIAPLPYKGSVKAIKQQLKKIVLSFPNTKLTHETSDSLHIEFRTAIFQFVDDVEIFIDSEEQVIHFKSSSRLGYWDFGVNRRRIEMIKQKFSSQPGEDTF